MTDKNYALSYGLTDSPDLEGEVEIIPNEGPLEVLDTRSQEERPHFDRLQEIVDDLEDQCTQTKIILENSSEPSAMMIQSYQKMMSEYRVALAELSTLQRPQDVVDEVTERVLQPFIVEIVKACTTEMNNLQQEMLRLNIQLRDAKGISTDIFKRLSERLQLLLPESKKSLNNYFGVKNQEREVTLKNIRAKAK